jgi:photosystem II oxygen-evolving enhancer protein 1
VNSLTYSEIKGTGLANRCYDVEGEGSIPLKNGYRLSGMCIQPTNIRVEAEKLTKNGIVNELLPTKTTTRQTYTLTGIEGGVKIDGDTMTFDE